jgi:putative peptidoglycan binding protein
MIALKRPMYCPSDPRGPTVGQDVQIAKFGIGRYETGLLPKPAGGYTQTFGQAMEDAVNVIQRSEGIEATGNIGKATWEVIWKYLDAYRRWQYRRWSPPIPVPNLGPIVLDGKAILDMRLTHNTDGIEGYPAFDDGWIVGRHVIAPEALSITEQSGAQGGDAFYARGDSGMRYWVGHILVAPTTGRAFTRGETMATIADIPSWQGGPHVHLGVNARSLGVELRVTGYGSGPTLGEQLKAGLSIDR